MCIGFAAAIAGTKQLCWLVISAEVLRNLVGAFNVSAPVRLIFGMVKLARVKLQAST
jgi:hypothetical protein